MRKNESYITLKDYKPRFPNKKTCQLINHSKSDIGETSKSNLNRINQRVLAATKVNRWKNTSSALEWFKNIDQKENCSFIKFGIENFYHLTSITLFDKAIEFVKKTVFSNDDISNDHTNSQGVIIS